MKYESIKTPEQLLTYMNENIQYGFLDSQAKVYENSNSKEFQNGCRIKWRLSSPTRLLQVKRGNCFDQVELERDWFLKNGYNVKTFYIWFELPYDNTYSIHTYLAFFDKGKWFYFEHSDYRKREINIT